MRESEPTKTPWPKPEYDNETGPNDEGFWEFWTIGGVAQFQREADAELAWRAVNAHAELVEALQAMMTRYADDEDARSLPLECWQKARAALSRAEHKEQSDG